VTTPAGTSLVVGPRVQVPPLPPLPPRDTSGYWRSAWERLRRDRAALVGGLIVITLATVAMLAPLIAPYDPNQRLRDGLGELGQPLPAGGKYLLGTDGLGRDLLSRLIWGGQVSLVIGVAANSLAVALGLVLGATAGYAQGAIGQIIMRTVDVLMAFPPLLLAIALAALLRPSVGVVITVIALTYWIYLARIVYGQTLSLREKEFVEAARAQGAGNLRIMTREILPNIASSIIVFIPLMVANAILLEAALSFLGAGVQPPNPSWGTMIGDGIRLIPSAMHLTLIPGGMLVLAVLGINVFGDGVRDALDPRAEVRIEH
jgi:peptide/nickel transport system permease protein